MATQLLTATAVIPAGTPIAAPVTVDVSFPPLVVERIRWRVPKGAQGLMGWRLTSSGAQVVPSTQGAFIVAAGEAGTWMLEGWHATGDWHVTGYNTGAFPHSVTLDFWVRPISALPLPGARYAAIAGLAAAPEVIDVAG